MASFVPPNPPGVNPDDNNKPVVLEATIIMFALAVVAVVLRFVSRRLLRLPVQIDDWLTVVALVFASALVGGNLFGVANQHLGQHVGASTPDSLREFLAAVLIYQINYGVAITCSKLSMLAFYWRIFPVPTFKLPAILTATLIGAWMFMTLIVSLNTCHPLKGAWDILMELDGTATCINRVAFYIGQGAANICIDLILLALPLFMIWRLQMDIVQKAAVGGIFVMGGIVTVCSCLRLWQLVITQNTGDPFDPTWSLVGPAVWTVAEANLAIVCACLPSMRPLLKIFKSSGLRTKLIPSSPTTPSGNNSGNESMEAQRLQPAIYYGDSPDDEEAQRRAKEAGTSIKSRASRRISKALSLPSRNSFRFTRKQASDLDESERSTMHNLIDAGFVKSPTIHVTTSTIVSSTQTRQPTREGSVYEEHDLANGRESEEQNPPPPPPPKDGTSPVIGVEVAQEGREIV